MIRLLILLHRWLGVVFCLIFFLWFVSGVVMVFKRMPEYSASERLARLPILDPERVRLGVTEAATRAAVTAAPRRVRLTSVAGRPAYQFTTPQGSPTVFADDGALLAPVDEAESLLIVRTAFPEAPTPRYIALLDQPDQWTFSVGIRSTGPLHKIALQDSSGTEVYVARSTGEIVMKTDRSGRRWGYAGAVLHWIYFTPLRVRSGLWSALIIYGSLVGCVMCVAGLILGVIRYSPSRRYHRDASASPYVGWLRWHHYFGLIFGLVTFTWLFSGMLSMTPWNWSPGSAPTARQVEAVRGGPLHLAGFTATPADVLRSLASPGARELELQQFMGAPYYDVRFSGESSLVSRLISGADARVTRSGFTQDELLAAARQATDLAPEEVTWLTDYDSYYYDKDRRRPLPVLRVKFGDADQSWLYLNARDGQLLRREVRRSRLERWLYHGLHSLDVPFLYRQPVVWYVVVLALSAGGILLSGTSVVNAWQALRRRN